MAQDAKPVKIGWAAWSDAEFITQACRQADRDEAEPKVELVQADIAPLYQGVARGDLDTMMMAWLPQTHADYYARSRTRSICSAVYDGAKLGWVVPGTFPPTASRLDRGPEEGRRAEEAVRHHPGIDPRAGLTRLSEKALKDYELDGYKLQVSSEAGMLTTVDRATRGEKWFVATAWARTGCSASTSCTPR